MLENRGPWIRYSSEPIPNPNYLTLVKVSSDLAFGDITSLHSSWNLASSSFLSLRINTNHSFINYFQWIFTECREWDYSEQEEWVPIVEAFQAKWEQNRGLPSCELVWCILCFFGALGTSWSLVLRLSQFWRYEEEGIQYPKCGAAFLLGAFYLASEIK